MMKKYILLICSALFILGLTTCTNEGMDFDTNGGKGIAFVHFVGKTKTISAKPNVTNSTGIIVSSTVKSDVARTYNLVVDPSSTAIEGVHYTLSSKTITIPAGQYCDSVIITANLDNLTPEAVTVNISLNSDDAIDYAKDFSVSMFLFFEVTMDWLVGTWLWTDFYNGEIDEQFLVEIEKIDDNTISITNIWEGEMTIEATVDFENARIAIKPDQVFCDDPDYGNIYMDSRLDGLSRTAPIFGICSYNGSISIDPWGAFVHDFQPNAGWFTFTSILTRP